MSKRAYGAALFQTNFYSPYHTYVSTPADMTSWNDLPHEVKRLILNHFLENLLDEAGAQVWRCSDYRATYRTAEYSMPSVRREVDDLLDVCPEMRLDLLEQCRKRGCELDDEAHVRGLDYYTVDRKSEVAFRLEWHVWIKGSEYLRRKQEGEGTRRKSSRKAAGTS